HSCFQETGLFAVYAGTSPANAQIVLELLAKGLREAADGLRPGELERAKEQIKGSLMIGLENTANRMSRIARMELFQEEWLTPDDVLARIDQVSEDDVRRLTGHLFSGDLLVAAVGPVDESIADAVPGALGEVGLR